MDYRCLLGLLGNSSITSESSDPVRTAGPSYMVRPSGLFFVAAELISVYSLLNVYLNSSSIYLNYFILAVPMRERLTKHSCMSSRVPSILNGTCFFRETLRSFRSKSRLTKTINNNSII